jgi:hypothetical protein
MSVRIARVLKPESINELPGQSATNIDADSSKKATKIRTRELAVLVFDGCSTLSPQGTRSSSANGIRHLCYRSGEILIEVRFEFDARCERFELTGQVFEERKAMVRMPVHLLSGAHELACTSTNKSGLFCLDHAWARNLQVSLHVSSEKDVYFPLDETVWRVVAASKS